MGMLSKVPFFSEIGCPKTVERLERSASVMKYDPGQLIFEHDDVLDFLYVVKSGEIKVGRISGRGKVVTFSTLTPGSVFGEVSVFGGGGATARAEAGTKAELLVIPRSVVLRVFSESPQALMSIIQNLCRLVQKVSQNTEARLLEQHPSARIALARLFLTRAADGDARRSEEGIRLPGVYRQGEMAKLTGYQRQVICGHIKKLKEEAAIDWNPDTGRLTVLSEQYLRNIVEQ